MSYFDTIAIRGNVTLSDPKAFIGLVTVGNTVSTTFGGNVTLDAGSKTQVIGNVTLSDSKTFIGLTTTTLGASPAFVGIVTVTNKDRTIAGNVTLDAGSKTGIVGNVTLDAGSKTGIVGNLTLSDPKGFIGLVTSVIGGSTITPFGQFLNQASLISIASGGFGPIIVDQYGRQVMGAGNAYVGLVTVDIGTNNSVAIKGNVTLSDSKGYIGLVSVAQPISTTWAGNVTLDAGSKTGILGNVTLSDAKTYIGLTTTTLGASSAFVGIVTVANPSASGNVTLDPGSKTQIVGNVTLSDAKTYIGLVTSTIANSPSIQSFGQFYPSPQSIASGGLGPILLDQYGRMQTVNVGNVTVQVVGNVTLSDAKTYIGLVTVTQASSARTITGNVTLSDAKTYIGLVTSTIGSGAAFIGIVTVANPSGSSGNVTLDPGSKTQIVGNVTLSDSKGFIGLTTTTLGASPALVGIVTVANKDRTITGNLTLSDAKTYIGLVTSTLGASSAFVGIVTVTNRDMTITGNLTLSDAKTYIGLVTTTVGVPFSSGTATAGNASIGTTPVLVVASDANTVRTVVQNISNTTVFVSHATLSCNASLSLLLTNLDSIDSDYYTGDWYAGVGAGSAQVRFLRIRR